MKNFSGQGVFIEGSTSYSSVPRMFCLKFKNKMYLLYTLLYSAVVVFILPFQYLKRPKELRKRWLREKFGFIDPSVSPLIKGRIEGGYGSESTHTEGIIWVHAVSVGEVMAAIPLLKKIREKYPSKGIMLSTITDTGQKIARERVPESTMVFYLPFDIPIILKRVFKRKKPELLITIETELWPNLFRVSRQYGSPVILLNGRISEKSFKGYKKVSFFVQEVLSNVALFCMQSETYAERISNIGVDELKIKVLGNFKFDIKPPSGIPEWSERMKGPVLIGGSTHEGEEEFLLSVYMKLKKDFPDLNLILAPRHPERFKNVEDLLRSKGLYFIKRSAFIASNPPSPSLVKGGEGGIIILLDTVGELSAVYGISDIAIIGKSFKGHGGQNPLEPAYWGKPIVCGPHMENFPFIKDFFREGAALEVNEDSLYSKLRELLLSPEKAKDIGLKSQQLYKKNTGAVERAMEVIAGYIN
jgi:3-deoxy-D-manno-octulosonic-acid transferase